MRRCLTLLLLLALFPFTAGGQGEAQEGTSLSVDPSRQTIGPADGDFEVRIMVEEVTTEQGLGGYTLVMNYDPSIVHARAVTDSGFVGSTDNAVLCPASAIDNDAGRLAHFCFTAPFFPEPGPQTTEPQVLVRVTFEPVGQGTTTLDISESSLIDPDGNSLEAAILDGEITVQSGSSAPTLQPTPGSDAQSDGDTEQDGGQNIGLYVGLGIAALLAVALLGGALVFWRSRQAAGP